MSGLDYFNARYYSPAQGRFVSPDPGNAGADLGNPQTWNGYAYVGNNPLAYTDPAGLGFGDFLDGLIHNFLSGATFGLWDVLTSAIEGHAPSTATALPGISDFTGCGGPLGNCGTMGGAWTEESAIGSAVQDPSRFVSDLTGAERVRCAAATSDRYSLNGGLAAAFGYFGLHYNRDNFLLGAFFGSSTATISNVFTGPDRSRIFGS